MNSNNSLVQEQNIPLASSKHLQLLAAAALGLVILFGVGFAPMDMAHNAAHDTRHSVAFPCH
ncbi:MAG: CbtB domain-containing protein [Methyloprofundus sp.]|nr:CbtB-domain containing protein [Methyloprofundus sp.]MDT8424502.1 CbtB domain-containing protein [Methyloprofundus sp.]